MALELAIVDDHGQADPRAARRVQGPGRAGRQDLDGDKFVSSEEFTITNEAFHIFLFSCVGNEHLLQAYTRLEVPATMAKVLRKEHRIDGAVDADHLEIVAAFEEDDLAAARKAMVAHNEHAKATMAAASMNPTHERRQRSGGTRPPRPDCLESFHAAFRRQGRGGHRRRAGHRLGRGPAVAAEGGDLAWSTVPRWSTRWPKLAPPTASRPWRHRRPGAFEGALSAITAAVTEYGRIDVLINNVGGTIWAKPFEHYSPEEIEKEIQRSLFPTLWMLPAAFAEHAEAGAGIIVNVSSVATRGVNRVPYAAAKGGVKRHHLGARPGRRRRTASAWWPPRPAEPRRRTGTSRGGPSPEQASRRRPGTSRSWTRPSIRRSDEPLRNPRRAGRPIVFLASDEASYITGSTLPVAGGDLG